MSRGTGQRCRSVTAIRWLAALVVTGCAAGGAMAAGEPLPGQIIVDPANPAWLARHDPGGQAKTFFLAGPGDPEGFLYRGTRQADGTRVGDQMALIDKLAPTGANSIYFQAVRSHGGDGDSTHNPFVDSDPAKGLDPDILSQWETWFTAMDSAGIAIYFFFYDDSARIWNTGDAVGAAERAFVQGLVNAFEHHGNLVWCVAEEYAERYSAVRVSNIAAEIRAADDHSHVIAVHQNDGLVFAFPNDPCIDQFAIQYNQATPAALHGGMVTAWNTAAGRYGLNMSEAAGHASGTRQEVRRKNWACAMGGAYVMVLGMDIATTPVEQLEDLGRMRQFFEATRLGRMSPHDELACGGTQWVLADPGACSIAYAADLVGDMGLKGMAAGLYDFTWFDAVSGQSVAEIRNVAAGDQTWPRPAGIGTELALYVNLVPEPATLALVAAGLAGTALCRRRR